MKKYKFVIKLLNGDTLIKTDDKDLVTHILERLGDDVRVEVYKN